MSGHAEALPPAVAEDCAHRFACLADPTRLRLLHAVAVTGTATVGEPTELLGISQSTCSHHVRTLAEAGFVVAEREGTTTRISAAGGHASFPLAAEAALGLLAAPGGDRGPVDVTVRSLVGRDWPAVRRVYAEGIATGNATFETEVPTRAELDAKWLAGHRWVAEVDGQVAGWAALTRVSERACYAGVAETSVYVGAAFRGRGVGKALLHKQITAADADGLWTLQNSVFPENRASLVLHRAAGFRAVGVRERIGQLDGAWRDTVLLERRAPN